MRAKAQRRKGIALCAFASLREYFLNERLCSDYPIRGYFFEQCHLLRCYI